MLAKNTFPKNFHSKIIVIEELQRNEHEPNREMVFVVELILDETILQIFR
jgi:hypothetical protein